MGAAKGSAAAWGPVTDLQAQLNGVLMTGNPLLAGGYAQTQSCTWLRDRHLQHPGRTQALWCRHRTAALFGQHHGQSLHSSSRFYALASWCSFFGGSGTKDSMAILAAARTNIVRRAYM